jgi:putative ATP-binding cassette transporter
VKNLLTKIFRKRAAAKPAPAPVRTAPDMPRVYVQEAAGTDTIVFKDLVLHGPDGKPLVDYGNFTFSPGDRVMIAGAAGSGKSAGLAALRNAWLLGGSGEITVPPEIRFVPQEEYFPDRTLRGIICAPDDPSTFTQEQVVQAMADAGLAAFVDALDDETKRGEYWKNTLSGGQKNKVGFAGIFLHAAGTKVLIVDEITAALDAKSETELYPRLLERMKHGIVISVAHHSTLAPLHNVFAKVADGKVSYTKTPEGKPAPANTSDIPPAPPKMA